ncbi:MAG: LuxR family transcriptional regulator [Hyphomicrobiaceae bacterium]|nr:LuxR family transcriptional regulator [Hyphomicrobiaceae bacterium]
MHEFEEFIEECQRVGSVDELADLYSRAIGREGYENCILTSIQKHALTHVAWFKFPRGYLDTYYEQRWAKIDPVLECSLRASRPFFWNDVVEQRDLSKKQENFMHDCQDIGVHSGIVFPMHGPGDRLEIMSVSRRENELPNPRSHALLHAVSVQTWTRYLELRKEDRFPEMEDVHLTPRELEILRWCKHGKTYSEIGEILSISAKTVEFHVTNVMNKLRASNKITAIVIAIQRGILDV